MSKTTPLPGLTRVDHVGLTVPDLDAAVAFYAETFGAIELFRLGPFDAGTRVHYFLDPWGNQLELVEYKD